MKRVTGIELRGILLSSSTALALSLAATAAQANLIIDPGFEAPAAASADVLLPISQTGAAANPTYPWYDLLTNGGDQAEISSDVPGFSGSPAADRINSPTTGTSGTSTGGNKANSGDQYDYGFTAGRSPGAIGGVAQLITGINPGDSYTGSAWFFDKDTGGSDGDRFQSGGSNDTVKMIFEDASGNALGTVTSTIGGLTGAVAFGVTENTWIQVSTASTAAPAGTSQILFEMALTRGATGGVQFGDDADLEDTSVPEPASLGLLAGIGLLALRARRR